MPPMTDTDWMHYAIDLAKRAAFAGEVPVGAVLVCNDAVIGEGHNAPISAHDPSAHAEILALRNAAAKVKNYRLPDTTLYVTLEPCVMCAGALIQARIKRLVFGAYDPRAGAVGSVFNVLQPGVLNHTIAYEGGLLAGSCGTLLTTFFKERR